MKNWFVVFCIFLSFFSFSKEKDSLHFYTIDEARTVHSDSVFALDISKKKLTVLPKEIRNYRNLRHLRMGKNNLSELPDFITEFKHLIYIDLSKNKFSSFPTQLCKIKSLRFLILNQNSFTRISESIINLNELEYIDLWDTPLETFPDAFLSMKNLKKIDMRGVVYGPTYQNKWIRHLHWIKIEFDAPCDCMEK